EKLYNYLLCICKSKSYLGSGYNMATHDKLLIKILRGASDANIPFSGLCNLLKGFGFDERIRGDHHIFTMNDVEEILNLQPIGSKAKAYQVKQIRNIILKYKLNWRVDDE
ncbi:MAG: hypothetical protein KAU60_06775, partial [Desulfobacterales bacterium]|nr:hypothetical protein [Desulfobacterales bacterium]